MAIRQSALEAGELAEIEVESLSYSPDAVGRVDGFVVFVGGSVPGDRVLARVTKVKEKYAFADVVDVLSASPYRCQPPCAHFLQGCGGCQWQHITYEYQLVSKREIVRQSLKRIGKLEDIPEIETHGMEIPLHYRNKLTLFRASTGGVFGTRRRNSHKVVPIMECPISSPMISTLISLLQGERGNIDKINIRRSDTHNQVMLLCVYRQDAPVIPADVDSLANIPGVVSVFSCVESGSGYLGKFALEYGEPVIRERVRGIDYKIGPECFFQVNKSGLEKLVDLVREFAGTDNNLVVDAHCGVGTFALQVADTSNAVIGRDISPPAVALAQSNARDNGITNAFFGSGKSSHLLGRQLGRADVDLVILDPPRQGCEKADLRALERLQPKKIIYISCNPTTLARDLNKLVNAGYQLSRLAMVDMFPMTYHLETVALCSRSG